MGIKLGFEAGVCGGDPLKPTCVMAVVQLTYDIYARFTLGYAYPMLTDENGKADGQCPSSQGKLMFSVGGDSLAFGFAYAFPGLDGGSLPIIPDSALCGTECKKQVKKTQKDYPIF